MTEEDTPNTNPNLSLGVATGIGAIGGAFVAHGGLLWLGMGLINIVNGYMLARSLHPSKG